MEKIEYISNTIKGEVCFSKKNKEKIAQLTFNLKLINFIIIKQ
jgi:hypothetical protein